MKLKSLVLAAMLCPSLALAGEFVFTPYAAYHMYDDKLERIYVPDGVKDDAAYGAALGYRFTPSIQVELDANRTDTEIEISNSSVRNDFYTLNGLYRFQTGTRVDPFLLLGGGEGQLEPRLLPEAKDTIAQAGLGLFLGLTDNLSLRGEFRGVYNIEREYVDGLILLGLQFGTGGFTKSKPLPQPEPAPAPVTTYVEPPPPPPPADTDGDGIPDNRDKCPDTPRGALVDPDGCPQVLKEAINKELHILFDTNKAVIKPEYKAEVEEIAKLMKQYPAASAEIQGHTDSSGSKKLNDKLSQERADAVRDSLINDFGIAADRIDAKGYGSSQPVADNKTAAGKAKNRRVIAVIAGERERLKMKKKSK